MLLILREISTCFPNFSLESISQLQNEGSPINPSVSKGLPLWYVRHWVSDQVGTLLSCLPIAGVRQWTVIRGQNLAIHAHLYRG